MNAGAAIWVAGQSDSLREGIEKAIESLDGGGASRKLTELREASNDGNNEQA